MSAPDQPSAAPIVDHQPRFPHGYRPGIGIIGCGNIVRHAHLPAYSQYGQRVVGVYDPLPAATAGVQSEWGVEHLFSSVDELLAHPEIDVVDIATHPGVREELIHLALDAGKHVLSQKPLAVSVAAARRLVDAAEQRGLKLAVNQNGRWAPPWRIATRLIEQGVIGEVMSVTHLVERKFAWIPGTPFDEILHFAIYDYAVHWIDITRCWLGHKPISEIRARDFPTPNQPLNSKTPWGFSVDIAFAEGSHALIRGIGAVESAREGHPFWVHGTTGVIRGSVLGNDWVELEKDGQFHRYELDGFWFPNGFGGTMGELLCAIAEDRQPSNSAAHNLLSLEITLAACRSADENGRPVTLGAST